MHHKIQYLFSVISAAGICEYLSQHGWRRRESQLPERLYFERATAEPGQTATVWTWASDEHAKYRHQVPNVVFTLSVVEERPALEIANEIFACCDCEAAQSDRVTTDAAAAVVGVKQAISVKSGLSSPAKLRRCVLHLAEATSVTLPHEMFTETLTIAAGEVIELAYDDESGREFNMHVAPGSIDVRASEQLGLRLLQGVAKPRLGKHWSASQIVCEELGCLEDSGRSNVAASILTDIGPLLARIDYELDPDAAVDDGQQQLLRRQAAVMAVGLAKLTAELPQSRQIVWNSCAKLIYPVGLRLTISSTAREELLATAQADDAIAPKKTLLWMKEHALAVL